MKYGALSDTVLRSLAPLNYGKYQIRSFVTAKNAESLARTWHVWCPVCVTWMCCKSASKYTLDGYIDWGHAAASLTTHRKIWHT